VLDEDHLQLTDKETQHRTDRHHQHLVVFENRPQDGFKLGRASQSLTKPVKKPNPGG